MKISIEYRETIPEKENYFSLFRSTGWNDEYCLSEEALHSTLEKSFYCISAYDGEQLVGFGRIMSDGILHAMIYEMIVLPHYQGRGIGGEILKILVRKCVENNIRDIQLFCARGKRSFYEKFGFIARSEEAPGMDYLSA